MPLQSVRWLPVTTPNIIGYEILYTDNGRDSEYSVLATVMHVIPGPNWDAAASVFYYNESAPDHRYYQIRTLDSLGNRGAHEVPTPFKGNNTPTVAPVLSHAPIDQDYGGPRALTYVTPDGDNIADATVRVYAKEDYDAGTLNKVTGITKTKADGTWVDPITVFPGRTYVIVFQKTNAFGPDTTEIIV